MNRLLSVVSMGLARRWKTILMFLGAWWIITSFLMKIFAMGTLAHSVLIFQFTSIMKLQLSYYSSELDISLNNFRLESQLGLTRKNKSKAIHPNACRFWGHHTHLRLINSTKKWSFI